MSKNPSLNAALKKLPEDMQKRVSEKLARSRENYENRMAEKVSKLVAAEQSKAEFETLVADKRDRLVTIKEQIAQLRAESKQLRTEIKDAKAEFKANK